MDVSLSLPEGIDGMVIAAEFTQKTGACTKLSHFVGQKGSAKTSPVSRLFKGHHTDSRETMLALLDIQADAQALLHPLRVKIPDGVVEKHHILAVIGPDKSGADRPVEPPHGTV
jgi:hypothetical protein